MTHALHLRTSEDAAPAWQLYINRKSGHGEYIREIDVKNGLAHRCRARSQVRDVAPV
jgi:hypothetical protein